METELRIETVQVNMCFTPVLFNPGASISSSSWLCLVKNHPLNLKSSSNLFYTFVSSFLSLFIPKTSVLFWSITVKLNWASGKTSLEAFQSNTTSHLFIWPSCLAFWNWLCIQNSCNDGNYSINPASNLLVKKGLF